METLVITKAQWLAIPRQAKRTHKDGTRVIKLRTAGGPDRWVKVTWKN